MLTELLSVEGHGTGYGPGEREDPVAMGHLARPDECPDDQVCKIDVDAAYCATP
jgi:hypothetical protein